MAIRVLHIVTYMGRGGLETMIMNYYRHIDREKVQFDFLVHRDFEADYDAEIEKLGGKIYRLPRLNPYNKEYLSKLNNFFLEHKEYAIVHSHLDCMAGMPLKYAEKSGVPVRIAHAHSSSQTKDKKYLLKLLYKKSISRYANYKFACADAAGKWMFGGAPFKVLNNAIDTREYIFNERTSKEVKCEFGILEDALVIGHVGRFGPPKNHVFIVEIFAEILKKRPDAVLLLVGEGELRPAIQNQVEKIGIKDHVIFAGLRTDVARMLQAMNVFLFPSIYEGLPVSVIEAQAAGLPCLISDKVPLECKKTNLVQQVPLNESAKTWSELVLKAANTVKRDTSAEIRKAGFDICENAAWLEKFYIGAT